ncbi:MAG: DnaJ domain-containing protein [Chloroflexota bacterium]|nr:DnaJ domain-containing protein [Chloroflexota bacterium]
MNWNGKDYYRVLGVGEDAGADEIKKAYRKLAFQHHPDMNPGNEQESTERFKEVNEAFEVLSNPDKRYQYDMSRKMGFGGDPSFTRRPEGYRGYSEEDIFRDMFQNPFVEQIFREFERAGLRNDERFFEDIFFSGRGVVFEFFSGPGGGRRRVYRFGDDGGIDDQNDLLSRRRRKRKIPLRHRVLGKVVQKVANYSYRKLSDRMEKMIEGIESESGSGNMYFDLPISKKEARSGAEKVFSYELDGELKKVKINIPAGVRDRTRIRLAGMGGVGHYGAGDLYLKVKVR